MHQSMILIKAVYPKTLVNTSSLSSLYERFQSAASHFICVLETVLNFWRPFLSSSTNTSHPLRGSLSSFGANPTTRAFLQALFNWFHLTQTSDGVSFTELRDTGPPLHPLPSLWPPSGDGAGVCVWDFSHQSVAGHLHTPSLWIGPPVAAPGRVPWCLYQTVKRDSPRLRQVPESQSNSSRCTNRCPFTSTKLQRSEGRVGETEGGRLGTPISLNKLPELGSRAHLYGYGYFYKASARLFTSLAKLLREQTPSEEEVLFGFTFLWKKLFSVNQSKDQVVKNEHSLHC